MHILKLKLFLGSILQLCINGDKDQCMWLDCFKDKSNCYSGH